MRNKETAVAGLGNNTVPAGYNRPDFDVGTAVQGSPNPEARLTADSAAKTPNGIDPLNKGFQVGGANDPLAEFEPAADNPSGMDIGGGGRQPPISSPHFPPMASSSFREDDLGAGADGNPAGFTENDPFAEDNPFAEGNPFAEDGAGQTFENADAIPAFEDIVDDPALAALPVDADGVIQPVVIPDEVINDPELGEIPDVVLPLEEPILDITEDDVDVSIPENAFENDGLPEAIPVVESFKLPENQRVAVSKGDRIFVLGRVRDEFTPKFAECAFFRALKSLVESKGQSVASIRKVGQRHEKVAIIGRSMLVEVARDWMLPGTNTIFEARDLLQIVSAKPVREAEEISDAEGKNGKSSEKSKKEDDAEVEKAKKEALLAYRRWKEKSKDHKKEDDDSDGPEEDDDMDDDADKAEKKARKERAKREAAMLERQRTGGWI
jgi:hypothetical protein